MTRRLLLVGVVLLLGNAADGTSVILHDSPPKQTSTSGFSVNDPMYDFGVIHPWATVSHTFELLNAGSVPMTIDELLTSCGCTTADVEKGPVAPGESVPVVVTLDPSELKGFVERTVTVRAANDAKTILRLRAMVSEPFHFSTRSIRFDHAEATPSPQEIVIEPAVQVTRIETENPVTADAVNEVGATHLAIRLNSKQLPETHSGVVFVRVLTSQNATPIPIRVAWERTPVFLVAPRQLVFGGDQRSGKITVESLDGTDFRITRVTTGDDRVGVYPVRSRQGKATITVHIRGDQGIRIRDTLVISTDRKEQPELRIPVLVLIP